jgi:hypothetical protein
MERNDEPRLAVLIDADNTAPKWAEAIFEEIATLREASVRRLSDTLRTRVARLPERREACRTNLHRLRRPQSSWRR